MAQVLVETSGGAETVYLYGHARLAQVEGASIEWFLGDALGSVRQAVDDGGEVVLARDYSPFGVVLSESGTGSSGYGFTGEQYDGYTQFVYLRARWMDPASGRFLSQDPWPGSIRQPSSLHKYLYVLNNPTNRRDPSGKQPYIDAGSGGGCWTPPPPKPWEALTPREYIEQYKTLKGSYHEIYAQLSLEEDFKSFRIPSRALLAMTALAESGQDQFTDMEYVMWVIRTRARFRFYDTQGYATAASYRTQILIPDQFEPWDWITKGKGQAPSNFKYAFDPKGYDARPDITNGRMNHSYQEAYRRAGAIMAMPYQQMPRLLRRIDSFLSPDAATSGYRLLPGSVNYFADTFPRDNQFWDDYEGEGEPGGPGEDGWPIPF